MEKFAALSYPGMLPGLAMSFNHKGLVFAVNTLVPKETVDLGSRKKQKNKSSRIDSEKFLKQFQLAFS